MTLSKTIGALVVGLVVTLGLTQVPLHAQEGEASESDALVEREGTNLAARPNGRDTVLVGGGLPFGLYFPVAGAVCRLLETGIESRDCAVVSLSDSATAIDALNEGRTDFAMVQSDWLHHAVNGTSRFRESGPTENLRAVAVFHEEAFVLFTREGAGIRTLSDLEGRRAALGPASGYRGLLSDTALDAVGLDRDDLEEATEETVGEAIDRLCAEETDAVAVIAAHPTAVLASAASRCDIVPISFSDENVETVVSNLPGYTPVVLPAGTYEGQNEPVHTIGLRAVLATTLDVEEPLVEALAKAIRDGVDRLSAAHLALSRLNAGNLGALTGIAPLHPAAQSIIENDAE